MTHALNPEDLRIWQSGGHVLDDRTDRAGQQANIQYSTDGVTGNAQWAAHEFTLTPEIRGPVQLWITWQTNYPAHPISGPEQVPLPLVNVMARGRSSSIEVAFEMNGFGRHCLPAGIWDVAVSWDADIDPSLQNLPSNPVTIGWFVHPAWSLQPLELRKSLVADGVMTTVQVPTWARFAQAGNQTGATLSAGRGGFQYVNVTPSATHSPYPLSGASWLRYDGTVHFLP